VPAGLETLRAFLSDPAHYDGTASVRPSRSDRVVVVRVRFGPRRVVRYTWILSPRRGTTEVDLGVQIESRGIVYRAALLLGGRRWLAQRIEATLATVSRVTVELAEDVTAEPVAPIVWQDAA
jgi:hypothetical protein